MKYKVLWNDDECDKFASRPELQEYPELVIEFEKYQDICLEKLKDNANQFDAVILDANGISSKHPERMPNKGEFFHTLVDKACENKRLRTFVFSGQLHFDSSDPNESGINNYLQEKGFVKGKNLFTKTMFEEMLEQLRDDLNDYNAWRKYYDGNEFLLELIQGGLIHKSDREEFLDPIMKVYSVRDVVTGVGNNMRHILQGLLDELNKKFNLCDRTEFEDGNFGSIIHVLSKRKDLNPSLIIGPMWAIHNISNARSHVSLDSQEREMYFDASFSSFLLVTKWFNKVLSNDFRSDYQVNDTSDIQPVAASENSTKKIELIATIEESDEKRFIYAGDFQLEIRNDCFHKLNRGVRIKVSRYVKNTGPRSEKYHFFVRHNDYEIID